MFSTLRSALPRATLRSFSTTARAADLAKLTLVGRLGGTPETKVGKNDKEFVTYNVATVNFPGTIDSNGERQVTTSWHRVFSFQEGSNKYLSSLKTGSLVYVEAAYELREPEAGADPSTPQGQKTIFLRHETLRVLRKSDRETSE